MTQTLESILREALSFESGACDDDPAIPSAKLAQWFAEWRQRAQAILRPERSLPTATIYAQQFHYHLVGALRALELMQNRAQSDQHPLIATDDLLQALDHGGIHITSGGFSAMVFKQSGRASSCKRP